MNKTHDINMNGLLTKTTIFASIEVQHPVFASDRGAFLWGYINE